MSTKFDSEGFDLTASSTTNNNDIIYEIGGGTTQEVPPQSSPPPPEEPTAESERLKNLGNEQFQKSNHLDAYDYYTEAIEAAPYGDGVGLRGEELLGLKEEFEEEKRQRMAERQREVMERRRGGKEEGKDENDSNKKGKSDNNKGDGNSDDNKEEEEFIPPKHIYGHKLSIYHANRAATLLHMGRLEETIDDCTISILYNPHYVKAYTRRSTAYERNGDTESALMDARAAFRLQPNATTQKNVTRLEKIEAERMEKLKEETMGKLKDLGNSLLSNFGLSLDNFEAVKDPKSGGYSISFNQNK